MDDDKLHLKKSYELILHGILLSLETPVQWLVYNGHYADTLLHFCIRLRKERMS